MFVSSYLIYSQIKKFFHVKYTRNILMIWFWAQLKLLKVF